MGNPASDYPELAGLSDALKGERGEQPLVITGHKANFGHSGLASGIIAVVVASLVSEHRRVPPHINVTKPMSIITRSAFYELPVDSVRELPTQDPILTSISGTSISGDNIHLILQHTPSEDPPIIELASAPEEPAPSEESSLIRVYTELYEAQRELLSAPRKHRSALRKRVDALEQQIERARFEQRPTLTKPGYSTSPPLEELQAMPEELLRAVPHFRVVHAGVGSLEWDHPVNLALSLIHI
eukprot:TRINITY_DN32740_c0_g1_i2.p1 TRINITY_DN32740_c0_g1~~TRINITY_DN32740_c0_g1_i2.p1  ORF type:complete len:242 (+),score=27.62 TRINITY_DN32740_c0_g1_i2:121-846(+)